MQAAHAAGTQPARSESAEERSCQPLRSDISKDRNIAKNKSRLTWASSPVMVITDNMR